MKNVECIVKEIEQVKKELKQFFHNQLDAYHSIDDYKELLLLALLFLGDESQANIHINSSGAHHRARWMVKLIYCLKMYLFRSQFHLTPRKLSALRQFNVFVG